jgi:hypothetical protein
VLGAEEYLTRLEKNIRAKITDEEYLTRLEKNIYRIRQSQNANIWLGADFNLGRTSVILALIFFSKRVRYSSSVSLALSNSIYVFFLNVLGTPHQLFWLFLILL